MRKALRMVLVPASVAAVLASCAIKVPQSRQEFVTAVRGGASMTKVDTFTVPAPLDEVYARLKKRVGPCLDVTVRRVANVGYVEKSMSDYNPTLKKAGAGKAEFALQVIHIPRGVGENAPEGGLYIMAADLTAEGKKTRVDLFHSTMAFGNIAEAVKNWAQGKDVNCPKMK